MAALRPPAGPLRGAEGRRRDPSPLPAAGAGALRGSPSAAGLSNRDQVWEVLHQRERSAGDDVRQSHSGDLPSVAASPPMRPKQLGDRPGSPARYLSVPAAQDWNVPQVGAVDWKLPPPRRFRSVEPEAGPGGYIDMTSWVERRLAGVQSDCKTEIASKLSSLEQNDRHFKDWIQREQEQLSGSLQQLKTTFETQLRSSVENLAQSSRQNTALQGQCQQLEMRLHDMEVQLVQTSGQVQGLAQTFQALGAGGGGGGTGGTGASLNQAAVDALRMGLEREVAARTELSIEATDKIKELHRLVAAVSDRHHLEAQSRLMQQSGSDIQQEARLAALAPTLDSMRGEVDSLRESLRRTLADCSKRCEEAESACARRASNVQETAMSAAKELWEEHLGVVAECKTSLSSLQQILESKDKIMSQLQHLQQQQRADDKQEYANRHQQVMDAVRNRLRDVEVAFTSERNLRIEVQQSTDAQIGRMGSALEKAQSEWIKETSRLSDALKEVKQQLGATLDGEARGWERRLAEAVDGVTRRMEDLETRVAAAKATSASLDARLTEVSHNGELEVKELEARLKRELSDLDSSQSGRLTQAIGDLRGAVQKALTGSIEQLRVDVARVEESAALERSVLRAAIEDNAQHIDAEVSRVQEDVQQQFDGSKQDLEQRCQQLADSLTACRSEAALRADEVQAHADRASKDVLSLCTDTMDGIRREATAQTLRADTQCADLHRELLAAKDDLVGKINEVEAAFEVRLAEELLREHESMQHEVQQQFEEERRARIKTDSERVASLQRRFGAFEESIARQLDRVRDEQQEALTTHRQSVLAAMTRDRQEVRSSLEAIQQQQAESALAAKAELERLNVACESFAMECGEAIDRTAANADKAHNELEQRLIREVAAITAQAAVAAATHAAVSAECKKGLESLEREVGRRLEAQEAMHVSSQAAVQAQLQDLTRQQCKREEEMRADTQVKLKVLEDEGNERLRAEMTRAVSAEEQLQADMAKKEADAQAMAKELGMSQDKTQGEVDALRERHEAQEAVHLSSQAAVQAQLQELTRQQHKREEDGRAEIQAQLKVIQDEGVEHLQAEALRASSAEEHLRMQLEALEKQDREAQARVSELGTSQDKMRADVVDLRERLGAQETVQQSAQAALQAQLQDLTMQQSKREEDGRAEIQAQLKVIQDHDNERLQAEITRASSVEAQLQEQLGALERKEAESQERVNELANLQAGVRTEVEMVRELQEKASEAEAAAKEESSAAAEERSKLEEELREVTAKQCALQAEFDALKSQHDERAVEAESAVQEQLEQSFGKQKDVEERLAAMEQKQGETMDAQSKVQLEVGDKVATMQTNMDALSAALGNRDEALLKLRTRVDGGFAAINVKLEAERWLAMQLDSAADSIGNEFLRLLDQKTNHLEKRVEQIEEKVKD